MFSNTPLDVGVTEMGRKKGKERLGRREKKWIKKQKKELP